MTANINVWQDLALSSNRDHFLFSYGEESSSALMYNLFADRLLGTNLIPQSVGNPVYVLLYLTLTFYPFPRYTKVKLNFIRVK